MRVRAWRRGIWKRSSCERYGSRSNTVSRRLVRLVAPSERGLDLADAAAAEDSSIGDEHALLGGDGPVTERADREHFRTVRSSRASIILAIVRDDIDADVDAFVANVDVRSGNQASDILLRFVAERATKNLAGGLLPFPFSEHTEVQTGGGGGIRTHGASHPARRFSRPLP